MNFEQWVENVFKHEGGFVNDPDDKGGATNYGITASSFASFKGVEEVSAEWMERITRDDAVEFYQNLWEELDIDRLPSAIRSVYADFAVNGGEGGANRVLQMAINTRVNPNDPDRWIDVDGVVGSGTIAALESSNLTAFDYVVEQLMYYANNSFKGSSYTFRASRRNASQQEYPEDQDQWFTTRTRQNGYIRGWFRRGIDNLLQTGYKP